MEKCKRHCGAGFPANNASSSGTPGHGDGDPVRLKVQHSANHQHGAAQLKGLGHETECPAMSGIRYVPIASQRVLLRVTLRGE